jgi:hypothetical protein
MTSNGIGEPGDTQRVDLGDAVPRGEVSDREPTRKLIVRGLLSSFGVTIVGAFGAAVWGSAEAWDNTKSLLDLLLPAETALLGAAVAFYMTG